VASLVVENIEETPGEMSDQCALHQILSVGRSYRITRLASYRYDSCQCQGVIETLQDLASRLLAGASCPKKARSDCRARGKIQQDDEKECEQHHGGCELPADSKHARTAVGVSARG